MIGSIFCFLLLTRTRSSLGTVANVELFVSAVAVTASREAPLAVNISALVMIEAGVATALAGSNASPCAADGKLHFRPSQPTLEQWCP